MNIELRFFASLRESLGKDRERATLPPDVQTVGDLRAWLVARGDDWESALGGTRPVRAAVDQTMVTADAPLHDGAQVAFFPPVTGG